jgi:hypothetical protein
MKGPVNIAPDVRCGKCGGPVFISRPCCALRRKGWPMMIKCLRGCGWRRGYGVPNVAQAGG